MEKAYNMTFYSWPNYVSTMENNVALGWILEWVDPEPDAREIWHYSLKINTKYKKKLLKLLF